VALGGDRGRFALQDDPGLVQVDDLAGAALADDESPFRAFREAVLFQSRERLADRGAE
jgi:hypothetical protein